MVKPFIVAIDQAALFATRQNHGRQLVEVGQFAQLVARRSRNLGQVSDRRQFVVVDLEHVGQAQRSIDDVPRVEVLPQVDVENFQGGGTTAFDQRADCVA